MESPIDAGNKRKMRSASLQLWRTRKYALVMAAAWTAILGGSFAWYHDNVHRQTESIARAEARSAFGRDMLFRRWGSSHGGVYVPVSEKTQPNPNLSHIPERDIFTPSGRRLTLLNPAYMTRQIYEMAQQQDSLGQGHITSLKPLRLENRPDPWETKVLQGFERGGQEAIEAITGVLEQFNVPVATLQAEQKSTGFGFGELSIAHSLAAATGKSFDQLAQEFKSGKGWGVIARENNVKLGRVVSDLKRANKGVEKDRMERGQARRGSGASAGANSRAGGRSHGAMGSRGRSHR